MKYLIITLTFLFQSLALADDLYLSLGEERELRTPPSSRIWIEHRKIITATSRKGLLALKAKSYGSTELLIGSSRKKVHVLSSAHLARIENIKMWQKQSLGLHFEIINGQIHIKGHLYHTKYWNKLRDVMGALPWVLAAQMPAEVRISILKDLKEKLQERNLPYIYIHTTSTWRITLSPKDTRLQEYKILLEPLGVQVLEDSSALPADPLIRIKVTVAEVKRDFTRKLGVSWPENISANILPPHLKSTFENKFLSLNALENSGFGKILASPNILVKSGESATFSAGGEYPIKILHHRTATVEWKKYGINLKMKPLTDASGRMQIQIETSVSHLDFSVEVNDVPGLTQHEVKSTFTMNESKTIVLSGLIRNEDSKSVQGLPTLSRLPIIGALFGSQDFKENRSELLIFVKPEIVYEQFENQNEHLQGE